MPLWIEELTLSIPLVSRNQVESLRIFFDLLLKRFEFGLVGFEPNRGVDLNPGTTAIIFCEQRFREKKMCFRVAWIDIFSLTKPFFGLGVFLRIEGDDAEIVERALMTRVQVQDGAIKRLSCAWVILRETQIAQSKERFRIFGHVGIGDSEFFFG